MARAKNCEMKSMLRQVQSCLNLIAETDDATFERSWGVSRNQALKNLAKLCGDTLAGNPPLGVGQFPPASTAEVIRPAKAPDDFQISGITDAQDDQTFEGYRVSELRAAFEAVAPKDDWKGPIDAVINTSMFAVTRVAVRFFTATELLVKEQFGECYHVEADGYRAGPCGDH